MREPIMVPKCICTKKELEKGYIQGDLLIFPCSKAIEAQDYESVTYVYNGHIFHDVKFSFGRQYIKSDKPIKITHDKFDTIVLPPGGYWIQYIPDIIKIKK